MFKYFIWNYFHHIVSYLFMTTIVELDPNAYLRNWKIIEFPVTLMDAYLFTHMRIKEENIISKISITHVVVSTKYRRE